MRLYILLLLVQIELSRQEHKNPKQECEQAAEHEKRNCEKADLYKTMFERFECPHIGDGQFTDRDSSSHEAKLKKYFKDGNFNMNVSHTLRRAVCALHRGVRFPKACDFVILSDHVKSSAVEDYRHLAQKIKRVLREDARAKKTGLIDFELGCLGGADLDCAVAFKPKRKNKNQKKVEVKASMDSASPGKESATSAGLLEGGQKPSSPGDSHEGESGERGRPTDKENASSHNSSTEDRGTNSDPHEVTDTEDEGKGRGTDSDPLEVTDMEDKGKSHDPSEGLEGSLSKEG